MGKEDVYESDYLENPEIFADLVNGVLYHGEQVVKPEELTEQDGELRSILGGNARKMIRDKVKLWKGTVFTVFTVEKKREKYKKLSCQAKVLLTKLTNIKKIPDVSEEEFRKGDFEMCKAFEDMREEGKEEGRIMGRAEGIIGTAFEYGASEEEILKKLQDKLQISSKEAKGYMDRYMERV